MPLGVWYVIIDLVNALFLNFIVKEDQNQFTFIWDATIPC